MAGGKKYFVIHKPKGCLSQFSKEHGKVALCDVFPDLPSDVYPVGRLDEDSEGLLILSNDKALTEALLNPVHSHWRTYWVQVEGQITKQAIKQLELGVTIAVKNKIHDTLPAKAKKGNPPKALKPAIIPNRNSSWFKLSLQEGKYRQVRKMTAKVGFPTLRLVRTSIEQLELGDLAIGSYIQFEGNQFKKKLNL